MEGRDEVQSWRKAERARLIDERMAVTGERRRTTREAVRAVLRAEVPPLRRGTLAFYWPFRGEIDLVGLVRELIDGGIRAALPVVVEKSRPLEFRRWEHGTPMQPGIWNIPVPASSEVVVPDILLVPLVGFDAQGYRLGYGGGYYDRTIATMPRRPLAIGIGYAFQQLPTIHPQPFDHAMDAIVTENGIRWHRRPAGAVASADKDPNVEVVECSSPPCFMHEL